MDTSFRPEAVRKRMKITFPDRLHCHQHCPLNDTITQRGDTQWSQFAAAFRDINPSGWQGLAEEYEFQLSAETLFARHKIVLTHR